MKGWILVLSLALTGVAVSEEKPAPVPVISPELKVQLYKAQLTVERAKSVLTQAQNSLNDAIGVWTKACAGYDLGEDLAGEPTCKPKPVVKPDVKPVVPVKK